MGFRGTRTQLFLLSLLAGVFTISYVTIDVFALNAVSLLQDPIFYGFLGVWLGLIISSLLLFVGVIKLPSMKNKLGTYLDPHYIGIRRPSNSALKYIFLASIFNALGTLVYLGACTVLDPSIVLPLMQFLVVYLIVADFLLEKETPVIVEVQALLMVTLGAVLATLNQALLLGSINQIGGIILVLGPLNLLTMGSSYYQKRARLCPSAKTEHTDALTIRFYTTIGLAIIFTLISVLIRPQILLLLLDPTLLVAVVPAALSMVLYTLYFITYLRAIGKGKLSIVNAIVSVSVVLSIPVTLIGTILIPGVFGDVSTEPFFWIIKIIGAILICVGIISLSLSEIRFYLFFKKEIPYSMDKIFAELIQIKGVQKVASCTGTYDGIILVRTRAIGKSYNQILMRVTKISGIAFLQSFMVYKDWEQLPLLQN
ncbi:MAG: hypothetical protein ACFFC7_12895 [Candidatus Hermodarchaeota archaeon]